MTASPFPVTVEHAGPHAGVATLTLEQPGKPVVVLNSEILSRLDATLAALPQGIKGLVLASSAERAFVAGADLGAISALGDAELLAYLANASRIYLRLSQLPFPTAAAIHAATLGGGFELAAHCDGLIGAPPAGRDGQPGKPYPVGLPEAGLAICPGWGGTCLLPARIDPARALQLTAAGKPLLFDDARGAGMFDEVAPDSASLLSVAKGWVSKQAARGPTVRDGAPSRFVGRTPWRESTREALARVRGELSSEPGRAVVGAVEACLSRGSASDAWKACLEVEQRELVRLRHLEPAKVAISAFFAKSGAAKA